MKNKILPVVIFSLLVVELDLAQQPVPVNVHEGLLQGIFENGLTV